MNYPFKVNDVLILKTVYGNYHERRAVKIDRIREFPNFWYITFESVDRFGCKPARDCGYCGSQRIYKHDIPENGVQSWEIVGHMELVSSNSNVNIASI